jgi:hypothetical protein
LSSGEIEAEVFAVQLLLPLIAVRYHVDLQHRHLR